MELTRSKKAQETQGLMSPIIYIVAAILLVIVVFLIVRKIIGGI